MPVPTFDESTRAEKLPLEVFRWLSEASMYVRSTPDSAEETYNVLKLLLRLLAVRNPESQSHAIRQALGILIGCICAQPNTEKVILDLLALLIRMIDGPQMHRYNPMKHLAIAGLGHLAKFFRIHMKQMSANVFLICVDSFKIAPVMVETLRYRNTLLWSMAQSAVSSIDEVSIKTAAKMAKTMIEDAGDSDLDAQTLVRGFHLMKALVELPGNKFAEKKLDSFHTLFLSKGISSSRQEVRIAAARFYNAAIIAISTRGIKNDMTNIINSIIKLKNSKHFGISVETSSKIDGYTILLKNFLEAQKDLTGFETIFEDWMAPLLLQLDPPLAKLLIVDVIVQWKLDGVHSHLDIIAVLVRQLALSQAPSQRSNSSSSSSSKSKNLANSKPRLESVLACLISTVAMLGSAVQPVAHAVHQATLSLAINGLEPLSEEQLAWCIQCLVELVRSMPPLLISTIEIGLKQFEVDMISSRKLQISYVISAMVAQSKYFPLYGDVELNSRVALLGAGLIKSQADMATYKAGWTLLCGIFSLGPDVVKPLIPQLLMLWEAHLSSEACKSAEIIERALTGLAVFLVHNRTLLTTDVCKRIGEILNSVWSTTESMPPNPFVRRRLLQCYEQLLSAGKLETYPSSLLMKFVAHVTLPTRYSKETGVAIESAISNPGGLKTKSSEHIGLKLAPELLMEQSNAIDSGIVSRKESLSFSLADDIDLVTFSEIKSGSQNNWSFESPRNVYTTVVDLAVSVSAKLLPIQPFRIQESVFDAILANLENTAGQDSLRKIAVSLNIATMIHSTLKIGFTADQRILNAIITIIKILLGNSSEETRELAAMCCGILVRNYKGGNKGLSFLSPLVKELLEYTVSIDAGMDLRAGSILALGYIAKELSQRSLLDAMYKVFMRFAADPRRELHVPIVKSMKRSLMTSALIDQKYVRLTLKTLSLTYLLESHNNHLTFQKEVAECLAQIVSRVGPLLSTDLQESNRAMIICLADQLQSSSDVEVRVLAWKSFIEIYYYARHGITWSLFIKKWRDIIIDSRSSIVEIDAAVSGLLILMKLSAKSIFTIAGPGFEDALWLLLDKYPRHKDLRSLLITWLDQTIEDKNYIMKWIRTLDFVVMKPRYFFLSRLGRALGSSKSVEMKHNEKSASVSPSAIAADEDVALEVQTDDSSNEQLSWEARNFALSMLLRLLECDLRGKSITEKSNSMATRMIGDIVKIAFSSATSQIFGLQYSGLTLLNQIVCELSGLTDPDFPQISLLEQYQVQIISALTPAFGHDSSPGLALNALNTCATFITSDIVKTQEKLHRLIKLAEDSLNSMSNGGPFTLGKLEMSEDAARVLQTAVLSLWAQIQNNSDAKQHLKDIVRPHKSQLVALWKESVYEFGKMNSALVSQWSSSTFASAVDQMKDTQLHHLMNPIAGSTWLNFVRALSTVEDTDGIDNNFRLVLCGLCFQALLEALQSTFTLHSPASYLGKLEDASSIQSAALLESSGLDFTSDDSSNIHSPTTLNTPSESSLPKCRLAILQVLSTMLTPTTCAFIMESAADYFDEAILILHRAMLIGTPDEKVAVLKIAHSLVAGQPDTDDSVDHFFEILKVAIVPLRHMFPQLFEPELAAKQAEFSNQIKLDSEQLALLQYTMDTVIDIAKVFREVIQNDLWVCLLKVFEDLNHYEAAVVAPSFKRLLEILATQVGNRGVTFVVDALTVSLKRAVDRDSIVESLLICTAITCTNFRSLYDPRALVHIQRFGSRASEALLKAIKHDNENDYNSADANLISLTAIQCISAVLGACADTPTGGAFAYACLPALCKIVSHPILATSNQGADLIKQSATALSVYAVLDGTLEAFALVVPCLALIHEPYGRHLLLQLLTKHPAAFKNTIWQMDEDDRGQVQAILSQPSDSIENTELASNEDSDLEGENEITLKSFI